MNIGIPKFRIVYTKSKLRDPRNRLKQIPEFRYLFKSDLDNPILIWESELYHKMSNYLSIFTKSFDQDQVRDMRIVGI